MDLHVVGGRQPGRRGRPRGITLDELGIRDLGEWRAAYGLTRMDVARGAGVAKNTVRAAETGARVCAGTAHLIAGYVRQTDDAALLSAPSRPRRGTLTALRQESA